MSTAYNVGQVVFYYYGEKKRTLAIVHKTFDVKKELIIYYLDKDLTLRKRIVNIADIRKAIRGSDIIDVMDHKYIDDIYHVRSKLIQLSDIDFNDFTEVDGGSRKTKRRKSKRRKSKRRKSKRRKTNRNRHH
jgi:hypothetical protein